MVWEDEIFVHIDLLITHIRPCTKQKSRRLVLVQLAILSSTAYSSDNFDSIPINNILKSELTSSLLNSLGLWPLKKSTLGAQFFQRPLNCRVVCGTPFLKNTCMSAHIF